MSPAIPICRYSKKAYATIRRKVQPAYQSRSFDLQFYHMASQMGLADLPQRWLLG